VGKLSELTVAELLENHWTVVLLIGVFFLLIQLFLCASFWHRMGKYRKMVLQLQADFHRTGDGRFGIVAFAEHFPWLRWISESFPEDTTPTNLTRDDVLQELDSRLAADSRYLLLQRMGVMAPLLGVILTVMGFAWLDVPESEEQSLGQILFAVTPLVAGVGTGAVLAFINQGLLHLASTRVESLRTAARTWFDSAIWNQIGIDVQAATIKTIASIERMSQAVATSAEQQNEAADRLQTTTQAIEEAATHLNEALAKFSGEAKELPESMAWLHDSVEACVESLQHLIPIGERAVSGLDVSVAALRSTIDSQFTEASKLHTQSVRDLAEAIEYLTENASRLNETTSPNKDTFGQRLTEQE